MKIKPIILFVSLLLLLGGLFGFQDTDSKPASKFLEALTADQLEKIQHDFNDLSREDWHFFPAAMLPRTGLSLKELTNDQKALFYQFLKSYLSASGYDKVNGIISLESHLAEIEKNPGFRNPELYYIAFYGEPDDAYWSWSFEGHHVSLNFTIVDRKISMVPRFLGSNPAEIRSGKRKGERVLAKEEDLAFELLYSMTKDQLDKAIFQAHSFWDLVSSTSSQVGPLDPVGIAFNHMDLNQQKILLLLIQEYLSTMPEALAKQRMAKLAAEGMGGIRFGWAGATEKNKAHYYRIQGKTFLIEFDNSQNDANHIHTVWRDFNGDFGRDILKEHYLKHH